MTLFGGPKPPDPRKTFEARIERFLEANGVSGTHFWSRDDSLEALFNLVRSTQEDLSEARSKIRKNKDAHGVAVQELHGRIREEISNRERFEKNHGIEIQSIQVENGRVIQDMVRTHQSEVKKLKSEHTEAVNSMRSKHDVATKSLEAKHEAEKNKLISQLLVNVDDSHEWPDDKIKLRFGEVHRLIDSAASPQRREFKFPPDGDISKELDPAGFFQRNNSRGRGHFLIKGVLWEIIREQFFSLPYGLGAFGPGDTHKYILKALDIWKALTAGDTVPTEDSDLSIFETDRLSNRWRCLTFQRIQSNQNNDSLGAHDAMPNHTIANIAESNARIMNYLSRVAALSNNTVSMEVETEVKRATEVAHEIALQFGVHSSKFLWVSPAPDCDWDPAPGLIKCSQNAKGEISQRTIVKCRE